MMKLDIVSRSIWGKKLKCKRSAEIIMSHMHAGMDSTFMLFFIQMLKNCSRKHIVRKGLINSVVTKAMGV